MAAVSVTGSIRSEALREVLRVEDNPLAARVLVAWPPQRGRRWTDAEVPAELEAALEGVFERLYGLSPAEGEGHRRPVVMEMTKRAKAAWVAFWDACAAEARSAAWSGPAIYAARLALVVHLLRWAGKAQADAAVREADGIVSREVDRVAD